MSGQGDEQQPVKRGGADESTDPRSSPPVLIPLRVVPQLPILYQALVQVLVDDGQVVLVPDEPVSGSVTGTQGSLSTLVVGLRREPD